MKSFFEKLKQNRGAGMIIVVLAIVFLTAFGTLAMTMSYTSFEMSVAERQGKEAGYMIVFCICAVAYLIGWLVIKSLVPKYKPIIVD